jgi:hypothetical protein
MGGADRPGRLPALEPAVPRSLRADHRRLSTHPHNGPAERAHDDYQAKILAVEPNVELRWSAGLPGLIGGEHSFTLTPTDGGTRLVQSETFRGLLVPFSSKTLAAAESSYEALNNALKAYVEAQR